MENIDKVKKHYGVEFVDVYSDDLDYFVYTEDCWDGYEVTVATNDPHNLVISEHVHYYRDDVGSCVADAIRDGAKKIYCQDLTDHEMFDKISEELIEDLG